MSNAPTLARLRHVEAIDPPRIDARTFRQGWRVRTRLDRLLHDRRISAEQWQAAVEYRAAWARMFAGRGGELGAVKVSGGIDAHSRQIALVETVAALAAIERQIGGLATALCVACVVEDLSWPEIGRRTGRSHHTAKAWTVTALRALARTGATRWATRRGADGALVGVRSEPRRRLRAS